MGNVTVVMPNLNHGHYLTGALTALVQQTVPPTEILFFDDNSSDDSLAIVEKLKLELPYLKITANPSRRGVLPNIKTGLDQTTTEYIYFAAADDLVLPGFLAKAVELLDKNPGCAFCSQGSVDMDKDGNLAPVGLDSNFGSLQEGFLSKEEVLEHFSKYSSFMAGNATVYRTKILQDMGGFPEIGPYCDGVSILILGLTHGACISPYQRAAFRKMDSGYSSSVRKDIEKSLSFIESTYQWIIEHAPNHVGKDFPDHWRSYALYHIAAPLCTAGDRKGLLTLLPWAKAHSLLLQCGSIGRKLCELLLLRKMLPIAFKQLLLNKLKS